MNNTVLVIAAHPDDEILGCGGTMAKHLYQGDKVHVLILAEGITSRDQDRNRSKKLRDLSALGEAAHAANKVIGVTSLTLHDFPDNRMDSLHLLDVIKYLESQIEALKPNIIYTHHIGDVNIDHQVTHKAVVTACRPQPACCVKQLLFFEVSSSTEWQTPQSASPFTPNWFVDISDGYKEKSQFFSLKEKALEMYNSEMRPWPHARSIESVKYLARWRGGSVGVDAAEAFFLARMLK